ncbi:protein DOUBLE-STRAND BREAK FORMATION-like [Brassica napus]|uniref:protein DOUBLE-STRAND BREAK FORMATION-like n=1 Tax=Brassica napus TaxID=3708 RepID=UPI002078D98D|nr:protein DOUBLE-STRAND BREAK FORMATION-like [Brassica napus]
MSEATIADQSYLFLNRIHDRRFDEESLRILELSLVATNAKSFSDLRSRLRDFMRSESSVIFSELAGESVVAKLSVLEFFARAFALIGDTESCLAMKYEALTLREIKSTSCLWLRVSHSEWNNFAVQSMEHGFPSIARKASENALLGLKRDSLIEPTSEEYSETLDAAESVRRLRDSAASLTSSHSVQAQGAEYLRSKELRILSRQTRPMKNLDSTGSNLFREGINKRNERMLQHLRSTQMIRDLEPLHSRCI